MASNHNMGGEIKMDLAREPMPKLRENGSEKEEEEAIGAHLMYMNKVLDALKDREEHLSGEAKRQVSEFRANWKNFFGSETEQSGANIALGSSQVNREERVKVSRVESSGVGNSHKHKLTTGERKGDSKGRSAWAEGKSKEDIVKCRRNKSVKHNPSHSSSDSSIGNSSSRSRTSGSSTGCSVSRDTDSEGDTSDIGLEFNRSGNRTKNFFELMRNFDNRKVPMQEKFDEQSGQDLRSYVVKFEDYCRCNYRGSKTLWIGELERSLSGKTLEAFKALRAVDDSYREIKSKLLDWYDNSKEVRKKKNRKKFKNAGYTAGDSFYLFAVKLESLFKLAYPRHDVAHSQTLRENYLSAIPKSFRRELKAQISTYKLNDKRVPWAIIKKCANLKDLEGENDSELEIVESNSNDREIIINVGQAGDYRENRMAVDQRRPISSRQFTNSNNRFYSGQFDSRRGRVGEECHREGLKNLRRDTTQGDTRNRSSRFDSSRGEAGEDAFDGGQDMTRGRIVRAVPENIKTLSTKCNYCGRIGHLQRDCRTKSGACFICGQDGHFFRNCARNQNRGQRSQSIQPFRANSHVSGQNRLRRISYEGQHKPRPSN